MCHLFKILSLVVFESLSCSQLNANKYVINRKRYYTKKIIAMMKINYLIKLINSLDQLLFDHQCQLVLLKRGAVF